MISDSVPMMTAIDLLIIAATVYGIWRCRLISHGKGVERPRIGLLLIGSGLLAVALFYAADLAIMHVLPIVTAREEAMKAMEALHRNLSWLVILFAVISMSIGFIELLVELQRREAKVRRLIDANIVGIFIWGPDGRIVEANEAFLHITGYSRDDLVSKRLGWTELTPAEMRSVNEQRLTELKATQVVHPYETEYVQRNGGRVPVLVGMAMFGGTPKEGVAFVLNLTDSKKAELALREREQRHLEVELELVHANRVSAIGQLSASIAHEINQPIGAAITYANAALSWLRAQPLNCEEVRQALGFIVESGVRASEVIDRIRALVKKAPPQKDRVEINKAIQEVLALVRSEIGKNGVSAKTQLAKGLPPVWGDRVQLQQVMLNLLINAIEAMSEMEGSRELLVSTEKTHSDAVLVAVRDSGPGFPPESSERLFESFYTTKAGGLGLGLSICHSIIEAHEGRLWATAAEPRGAIFAFTVPARPDPL